MQQAKIRAVMDYDSRPNRRFQFGLRTIFVLVTIASLGAAWAAYNLNWIRERHAALAHCDLESVEGIAPLRIRLFGEQGYRKLVLVFDRLDYPRTLTEAEQAEQPRFRELFPEAEVQVTTMRQMFYSVGQSTVTISPPVGKK